MSGQVLGAVVIDLLEEGTGPGGGSEEASAVRARSDRLTTLAAVPVGSRVRVRYVGDGDMRAQAIRLGLAAGAELDVWARLPGGPVLVARGAQQIAVGRALAGRIWVEVLEAGPGRRVVS